MTGKLNEISDVAFERKALRIFLIDDIDLLRGGARALTRLIGYAETHFAAVIASARTGFQFAELAQKDAANALKQYSVFEAHHSNIKAEEKKAAARQIGFRIWGMLSTGIVAKSASLISSDKLKEDIADVVNESSSNAYRLIQAASWLLKPGHLPMDDIRKLAGYLGDNLFAFMILQSLAGLRIHLFHTSDSEKQQLCAHLKITVGAARGMDLESKKTKVLRHKAARSKH